MNLDFILNPIVSFLLTIATAIGTTIGTNVFGLFGDEILAGVTSGFTGIFQSLTTFWNSIGGV